MCLKRRRSSLKRPTNGLAPAGLAAKRRSNECLPFVFGRRATTTKTMTSITRHSNPAFIHTVSPFLGLVEALAHSNSKPPPQRKPSHPASKQGISSNPPFRHAPNTNHDARQHHRALQSRLCVYNLALFCFGPGSGAQLATQRSPWRRTHEALRGVASLEKPYRFRCTRPHQPLRPPPQLTQQTHVHTYITESGLFLVWSNAVVRHESVARQAPGVRQSSWSSCRGRFTGRGRRRQCLCIHSTPRRGPTATTKRRQRWRRGR
jgi:hypothetical protein